MRIIKVDNFNNIEIAALAFVYIMLFTNFIVMQDSPIALTSAFCGITYTILAGKGNPICYLFGVTGSAFYCYLAFKSALWGNLILYAGYYVPMQILGFFQWNKNLKDSGAEIIKTFLNIQDRIKLSIITILTSLIFAFILNLLGDKSPYIDGITTVFSIAGMYLTVKRCIEQWIVWVIVNGLSLIMWLNIAFNGEKVYSTVIMWAVYFILAIYFYILWKKDLVKN